MNLVIAVYTKEAFEEFIMPPVDNADYSFVLKKHSFGLRSDISIELEVIHQVWRLKTSKSYRIYEDKQEIRESRELEGGEIFRIVAYDKKQITFMVQKRREVFCAYEKYDLRSVNRVTIGQGEHNLIRYDYQRIISRDHAEISRKGKSAVITSRGQNGLYVNSRYVHGTEPLHFGDYINIYSLHMVFLGDILAVDTSSGEVAVNRRLLKPFRQEEAAKGRVGEQEICPARTLFHRSPRIIEKIQGEAVEIEEPPREMKSPKKPLLMTIGPSFTMVIPMLLGSLLSIASARVSGHFTGLFLYSGLLMAAASALIGTLWGLGGVRYQKKTELEKEARRYEAYRKYLRKKMEEIEEKYTGNQRALNRMYPDAETCMEYDEKSPMLWNRNGTHEDFLSCRLGLGDMEFQAPIQIPKERFRLEEDELAKKPGLIRESYKTLKNVPILLDLLEHRLVGLAGGKGKAGALHVARVIAAQLAAGNCYTDVKMVFVYEGDNSEDYGQWEFAKWLPHVWSADRRIRYIASNRLEAGEVFYEITKIFRQRMENASGTYPEKGEPPKPYFVLFLSDPRLIQEEVIGRYVLDPSPAIGLTTLMLTSGSQLLPNACEYIVENDSFFQGMYNVSAQKEDRVKVTFDRADGRRLESFTRRLSNIQVQEMETGGEIPASLTFFEMYGISRPEELKAEERWLKNRNYDNIRGLIGQKAGGAPCYVDVHEKYHGPHGLVAGMTGSGKSETLQTYMLSLAINYSPDDIGFFIIDYKGGGMANLFDGLPHMIGQISNLSGNQVYRAMVSIKSENRRRQRIFTEYGVNNINSYTKLYKNKEAPDPVPHLFIIIDEFAELKREEPDFMKELISVAQVGRSLGVHLILATQKPSGTVDDNIWSNARFRLCLRVQDRQDSNDMLHKPDAAYITQAGRCYLQVGNDEVYELFQSGWSGAPYDENAGAGRTEIARLLTINGKAELTGGGRVVNTERTQLDAVKDYLRRTAKKHGYRQAHRLWMPVLPSHMYLEDFEEYRRAAFDGRGWKIREGTGSLDICVGMVDDPQNQAQFPLHLDFFQGGHHGVIGSVVSGKSTLLQTILFSLVMKYTPEDINIYGLDFSSKMMSPFENLAHFGGIMYEGDDEKMAKFFNMIERILNDRKKIFRGGNYSQYVQSHGAEYPAILIVIDNFSAFQEKTESAYERLIVQLSREGVSHGMFLLLSAGGFGMNEIPGRIGENLKTVLCMELPDKFAYGEALHTTQIQALPEAGVRGRGLTLFGTRVLEFHGALALKAGDDYQRLERIRELCEQMNRAWRGKRARQIPEIPEKPLWELFSELDEVKAAAETDSLLPVGYDSANGEIYSVDLSKIYCYLITGAIRTGKKNFLKVMLESARLKKSQICLIDGEGLMSAYSSVEGISYVSDEEGLFSYFQNSLTPEFARRNQRKRQLLEEGGQEEELYLYTRREEPIFLFITDMLWLINRIYDDANISKGMKGFMETLTAKGRYHNIYFIGILNLEDKNGVRGYPAFVNFASYKTGIHFGGNTAKNPFLNYEYLSFQEQSRTEKAGIGQLPLLDGEAAVQKIVVPLVGKRGRRKEGT